MGYYPIFLDLQERPCTVIGAGEEAERKVQELIAAGARVTVICREDSTVFREMEARAEITLHHRPYARGDLAGAFLALAATTEDRRLSEAVADEARAEGVLLNVVDVTDLCTWIYPAIVRRGQATIAISTDGKSPAMARFLRERLDESLPPEYGTLLEILAEVRGELRRRRVRPAAGAWQKALDAETLGLLAAHEWDRVQARLMSALTDAVGGNGHG